MRYTFALITYTAALLLTPQFALADANPGACYNIQDADARAYCLARAHRDPGRCYSVQRSDLRSMCLAEVRH